MLFFQWSSVLNYAYVGNVPKNQKFWTEFRRKGHISRILLQGTNAYHYLIMIIKYGDYISIIYKNPTEAGTCVKLIQILWLVNEGFWKSLVRYFS